MSLLSAIQEDFPTPRDNFGEDRTNRRRPKNSQRFSRNMATIARVSRWRTWVIIAVVVTWFVAALVVALASKDRLTTVLALGSANGGAVCATVVLRSIAREQLVAEILLAIADRDTASLGELAELCRQIIRDGSAATQAEPKDVATATPPVSAQATGTDVRPPEA